MSSLPWWALGKLVQDVTSVTLVNNTAKTEDVTVPANKKWLLLWLKVENPDDVNRLVTVNIWNESGKTTRILARLLYATVSNGQRAHWPLNLSGTNDDTMFNHAWSPVVLDAGDTIEVIWGAGGASTGATDADALVICYIEVPVG